MTPQTLAEKVADVEARVRFLENFLPQVMAHIAKANTFFDKHEQKEETLERVQAERHQENKDKLEELNTKITSRSLLTSIAAFLVGLASLAVAILTIWVMVKLANHSMSDIIHIFTTHAPTIAKSVMSRY